MDREQTAQAIERDFRAIMAHYGYVEDGLNNLSSQPDVVAKDFGTAMFNYMVDSNWTEGWEDSSVDVLSGVAALFADLLINVKSGLLE